MATQVERDLIVGVCMGKRENSKGFVRVNCPICPLRIGSEDRRGSLGFRPLTGGFRCFRCGVNGRMSGGQYIPPEEADAVESTADRPKVVINRDEFFPLWTPELRRSPALQEARDFLNARGIRWKHWRAANIHAAVTGFYAGRVIVPHEEFDGEWWGFTARLYRNPSLVDPIDIIDAALRGGCPPPKVLYPKNMDRTKMYNDFVLDVLTDAPVMVVEGCLDAAWYLPDVVACLGKPTHAHFDRLCAANRPVCICLDGDAWEEGRALALRLKLRGVRASFVRLPPEEDPNSVDPDWLRNEVQKAA